MAVDTAEKRFSMINLACPGGSRMLFERDSSVDLDDRQHLLGAYSGIAFDSGGFFDERTYTAWDTRTVGYLEYSSLAYDERTDQQYFYAMDNGNHTIHRFTRDGCRVGGTVDWSVSGTDDLEGLCFLGPDGWSPPGDSGTYHFVLAEEHDDASPEMLLYFFNMDRDTTSISTAGYTVTVTGVETSNEWVGVSGEGLEGIAFDRVSEKFYVGVQNMEDTRGGFWEVTPDADASWAGTRLFYWYDVVGPGGDNIVPSTAKCGDVTCAPSWLSDTEQGRFFVLCNDGITSGASARVVEFDTSGNTYSSFDYGRDSQNEKWEGLAFDNSDDHDLIIIGEPTSDNWRRFSTRGTVSATTYKDWQTTWEYSDVNEDYVTTSPTVWDASFDPSAPPDSGTAFSSDVGFFGDPTISGQETPHSGIDTIITINTGDSRSHYFVGEFTLTAGNISSNAYARIGFVADEGCWLWINGTRIVNYNVADGDPTSHGQLAVNNVTGNEEGLQRWIEFDISECVAGTNRIVAVLAQESATNGDAGFDGRFELLDKAPAALPVASSTIAPIAMNYFRRRSMN